MGRWTRWVAVGAIVATVGAPAVAGAADAPVVEPDPARGAYLDQLIAEMAAEGVTADGLGELGAAGASSTSVMGASRLTADQIAEWYFTKGRTPQLPALQGSVRRLAQLFIEEGARDGVRGDVAFAQSMLETLWLEFPSGGQIRPWFNNYSGIAATDGRANGDDCDGDNRCFATPRLGVRYQIQLLRSYADPSIANAANRLIKAPSDRRGIAPTWERFGYCQSPLVWASACPYGPFVVSIYHGALRHHGLPITGADCTTSLANAGNKGRGYWVAEADGPVHSVGAVGNSRSRATKAPVVGGEPDGAGGYWLVTAAGGVVPVDARDYGDGREFPYRFVGMERTKRGYGYWLVTSTGRIYVYGRATFFGSANSRGYGLTDVAGMERTLSGNGYWIYTESGHVYPFGDAADYGNLTAPPESPIVSMARTSDGEGYWLLRANGKVDAFGSAAALGDIRACGSSGGGVSIVSTKGAGYWILSGSGRVYGFGDAKTFAAPEGLGSAPAALIRAR